MLFSKSFPTREEERLVFSAKMTQRQFMSLASKLKINSITKQLKRSKYFTEFHGSKTMSIQEAQKWLLNGWNTEYLLSVNLKTLEEDSLRNSIQWAFPQAYYSVFAITQAYFKVAGFTESSHTSLIRKVGLLMSEGKYPKLISCLAIGHSPVTFINIGEHEQTSTVHYDTSKESQDTHICQFLRSTRKMELNEKKSEFKDIKTRKGTRKKNFLPADWEKVSSKIGPTSIINLLYRKRIKSNYREIDTYLCEELDPNILYKNLIQITRTMNMVHESFILKAIGEKKYEKIIEKATKIYKPALLKRKIIIKDRVLS